MKITDITVSAGRVIPHPMESYSNLRANLMLKASLNENEDAEEAVKALQAKAEKLIEDHKNHLVESIVKLDRISREEAELSSLEQRIKDAQQRVADIRANRTPQLVTGSNGDEHDDPYLERYEDREP